MLRGLVVLLLAANIAFYAWSQGWLAPLLPAPGAAEREPERLTRQWRPDRITVLSPRAAAQAAQAAALEAAQAASAAASAAP